MNQTQETGKYGKVRIDRGERQQIGIHLASLDSLLPHDHRARIVWEMAEKMDMSRFHDKIKSVEGERGRPAIDPRLLVGVWLFATLEGVGSARELADLCREHIAYRWMMGGIEVNYHTLADFRVNYEQELDDLLVKGVAVLMKEGLVKLDRTAQDGLRVRASAGAGSFRKRTKLEACLDEAHKRVEELKQSGKAEGESRNRQEAAQKRAVEEREKRLAKALEELEKIEKQQAKSHHKKEKAGKEAVSSKTDPEARFMRMPAGEVRPAYNAELSIDTESRIIVGVDVVNQLDQGQMAPMLEQLHKSYAQYPREHLVDGGFATWKDIETATEKDVTVLSPLPKPNRKGQDPSQPRESDGPGVKAWRERMTTPEAKETYKHRAATIEWANALARMRGFQQMLVRGMHKVRAVLLWFALAHNLMQTQNLGH
jgi:transposase